MIINQEIKKIAIRQREQAWANTNFNIIWHENGDIILQNKEYLKTIMRFSKDNLKYLISLFNDRKFRKSKQ